VNKHIYKVPKWGPEQTRERESGGRRRQKLKNSCLNGSKPQGSLFGPISFVAHIDDLQQPCDILKHVDDITLSESIGCPFGSVTDLVRPK